MTSSVPKLPTKLYLHLSVSMNGYHSWAIFTDDHPGMNEYPQICSIDVKWPEGVTQESVLAQVNDLELGLLYHRAGEFQAKLDAVKEEINKRLCITHEVKRQSYATPDPKWDIERYNKGDDPDFDHGNAAPNSGYDDDIPF